MRALRQLGLAVLGFVIGSGLVMLSARPSAQVPSTEQLNARFVIGPGETAYYERTALSFRLMKDKRTGDCYLTRAGGDSFFEQFVKTDDDACSGF